MVGTGLGGGFDHTSKLKMMIFTEDMIVINGKKKSKMNTNSW